MLHLFTDWFGWPDGSVLTNLIASLIGVTAGYFIAVRRHVKSLHKSLKELHDKHDVMREHVIALRRQDGA